jgi:hypothetical protein
MILPPVRDHLGIVAVRTRRDHANALHTMQSLRRIIGRDRSHPLTEVLERVAANMRAYGKAQAPRAMKSF